MKMSRMLLLRAEEGMLAQHGEGGREVCIFLCVMRHSNMDTPVYSMDIC